MYRRNKSCALRVLNNPHAVAEKLALWSEAARRNGRLDRSDRLLLEAWEAFDLLSVANLLGRQTIDRGIALEPWHRSGCVLSTSGGLTAVRVAVHSLVHVSDWPFPLRRRRRSNS